MACPACDARKKSVGYINTSALEFQPFSATDVMVYDGQETRALAPEDWPKNRHKLLLFYPETFTPVCSSEMGALNKWVGAFNDLECDIYSVTTDSIDDVRDWYVHERNLNGIKYKALSSILLPLRLGLMNHDRVKRSSVIITQEGDMIKQEHFMNVGRSIEELHRTLYAYSTGSYCGEGWKSPADGFLEMKHKHDNHKKK